MATSSPSPSPPPAAVSAGDLTLVPLQMADVGGGGQPTSWAFTHAFWSRYLKTVVGIGDDQQRFGLAGTAGSA